MNESRKSPGTPGLKHIFVLLRVNFSSPQINGQNLHGRSHQTASSIIDKAPAKVKIVLIR